LKSGWHAGAGRAGEREIRKFANLDMPQIYDAAAVLLDNKVGRLDQAFFASRNNGVRK
jgi:hypothetical protein